VCVDERVLPVYDGGVAFGDRVGGRPGRVVAIGERMGDVLGGRKPARAATLDDHGGLRIGVEHRGRGVLQRRADATLTGATIASATVRIIAETPFPLDTRGCDDGPQRRCRWPDTPHSRRPGRDRIVRRAHRFAPAARVVTRSAALTVTSRKLVERHNAAWHAHDLAAIVSMHTPDMLPLELHRW
jgi:hypothetical protein